MKNKIKSPVVAGKHDTWLNAGDKKRYFQNVKKWRLAGKRRKIT